MRRWYSHLYDKAKIHVIDVAWNKSLNFALFCMLEIIDRRMSLPKAIFGSRPGREQYLIEYMMPRHDGCFVDVGANVGLWTLPLAHKNITVHAFEPGPKQRRILMARSREYPNVHVYPFALGEHQCETQLYLHQSSGHDSIIRVMGDYIGSKVSVTVRALDSFRLRNVGLIKIDTEGYEVPVLLGARQTILKDKPRLVIEVHRPYHEQLQRITKTLKQLNYLWFSFSFFGGRIKHIIGDPSEQRGEYA